MRNTSVITKFISVFTLALLALACSGNQIEEADKLITEANKSIIEADELVRETEKQNKELFATNIQTSEELQAYKEKMSAKAQLIVENFGRASDMTAKASRTFAQASALKVPKEYKEYLEKKSEEFAKRSAAVNARKGNAQAFLDYDDSTMVRKFEENNEKSENLLKEARELSESADRIREENKEIFKS